MLLDKLMGRTQERRSTPMPRAGETLETRPDESSIVQPEGDICLTVNHLSAFYGKHLAVKDINLEVQAKKVTAIIGPSGCGKSTLLRCMNRMHEETRDSRVEGEVLLNGQNIYQRGVDPVVVRRRIGMVFQRPNPFPTMSVFDNVVAGVKLNQFWSSRADLEERAERALRQAALWDEVKDKLKEGGTALSGGQQQRLCIARTLAIEPEVILMDEPCSALDPMATQAIEDLVRDLCNNITIIIVTHNMQQAARVSDHTAFMLMGELVEYGETRRVFTNPRDERTEAYITGRFG
jgi:phosphate transport system ATP-binding protein